jgi:hypothetical protein
MTDARMPSPRMVRMVHVLVRDAQVLVMADVVMMLRERRLCPKHSRRDNDPTHGELLGFGDHLI